jgi:hypothetical protein
MDMIPFGQLQLMSPPGADPSKTVMDKGDNALAGVGVHRQSQLNERQMRTFITMRALAASPLMMGGDLPTLDAYSLALITDEEMLACNQNGVMGSLVHEKNGIETWKVDKRGATGEGWIGVFNRTGEMRDIRITPAILGLEGSDYRLTSVWTTSTQAFDGVVQLEPNDVLFLKFD